MADLRQACDRCHDKKLRCPKQPGASSCVRCAKAGALCLFSPPTKPMPMSTYRAHANGPVNHDNGTDWLSMVDFEQLCPLPSDQYLPPASDSTPSFTNSAGTSSTGAEQADPSGIASLPSASSVTARLATIVVVLDGVSRKLPSAEVHHASRERMETWADQMGQFVSLRSSLENLLEYTQKLVAIYPEALKAASSRIDCPNADDACQVPDCIHRDGFSKAAMPEPTLDYALLSLLMSCHLRLVDIVETLVGHGRMCAHVVASLPPEHEPSFDVPDIRIGSFVAPRDTAASMLVSMLVELQMVLVSKSRDLSVIASRVSGSTEKQASVLKLQCEILCDRTVSALSQLASLREGLTRKGLMR